MDRYVCIHAHFYQPPRENPWLEAIEVQDSAYPFHDWNERITAECYAPNSASRILDGEGRIVRIVSNYSKISFNFGPTLLSWLEYNQPDVYAALLEADRESSKNFSGHGSALAQVYNHMILPLASRRDKQTQVLWGIRDFEHRFGRRPEGMWLSESAVDTETLEVLAENGIRFTILAPRQAARVRKIGGRKWKDVSGGRIDPTRAYRQRLPSGRAIDLFFYDGPISQAVAFEGLLKNGEQFAQRLLSGFSPVRHWPQLMHIATDGETYGHHHAHGDMALAYALHHIEHNRLAQITNYGEFLEKHPPTHEVEIVQNSSWSCEHGVERWRADCGCSTGREGWKQAWRAPVRNALDWLRDELAQHYEQHGRKLLNDPWETRDAYISVVLDRSPETIRDFLEAQAMEPDSADQVRILKLLEMQRHLMLMYTSCGWFFDEVSGIETVQVIQYATRALQLARELFGEDLEPRFRELLAQAPSNLAELADGGQLYDSQVKPAAIGLREVGAHYAISSLFEPQEERPHVFCYNVQSRDYRLLESGHARLAVGRAQVCSAITLECAELAFGVVNFGDHHVNAGVRELRYDSEPEVPLQDLQAAFERDDLPEVMRAFGQHFGGTPYSLRSLFRDQQRRILNRLLTSTLERAESDYRHVYDNSVALMRFVADLDMPQPRIFQVTAEFVLNAELRRAFEAAEEIDVVRVAMLLEAARRDGITLDSAGLGYSLRLALERMMEHLLRSPEVHGARKMNATMRLVRMLPFDLNLWRVQNDCYRGLQQLGSEADPELLKEWEELARNLGIAPEAVEAEAREPAPAEPIAA
jgi:alpha-amylase/alpha-mannosidase (GH57 family)